MRQIRTLASLSNQLTILQESAAPKFRYIVTGTLDSPDALPPRGEFFCENRNRWMPEIPGTGSSHTVFSSLTVLSRYISQAGD